MENLHFVLLLGIFAVASGNPLAEEADAASGNPVAGEKKFPGVKPPPVEEKEQGVWGKWTDASLENTLVPKIKWRYQRNNDRSKDRLQVCLPGPTNWYKLRKIASKENFEHEYKNLRKQVVKELKEEGKLAIEKLFAYFTEEPSVDEQGKPQKSVYINVPYRWGIEFKPMWCDMTGLDKEKEKCLGYNESRIESECYISNEENNGKIFLSARLFPSVERNFNFDKMKESCGCKD